MNFNQDKTQILAIGSTLVERNKKQNKVDKLMVISTDGKILHESAFVVNERGDVVYFLSSDLKTLKKHFFLNQAFEHDIHDVIILFRGFGRSSALRL